MRTVLVVLAVIAVVVPTTPQAQDYPTKPVRLVVGFSAGGTADTIARIIAQKLSELWGQPVIVDNRLGAGGTIAASFVAKALPDGYTLLLGDISYNTIAASLHKDLAYDSVKDFAHIARIVTYPLIIVVPSSSSITTLKGLISEAKARPGMLRYASIGIGTSPHIFMEMMNQRAGIKTEAIQYKGGAPALVGLLAGDVEYYLTSISTGGVYFQTGKLRALAVTSASGLPSLPGVPAIASEIPGYEAYGFNGLHAPANTPAAIVAKIQRDTAVIMRMPEVRQRMDQLGMDVAVGSSSEYAAFINQQIGQWAEVIRTAKIRAD